MICKAFPSSTLLWCLSDEYSEASRVWALSMLAVGHALLRQHDCKWGMTKVFRTLAGAVATRKCDPIHDNRHRWIFLFVFIVNFFNHTFLFAISCVFMCTVCDLIGVWGYVNRIAAKISKNKFAPEEMFKVHWCLYLCVCVCNKRLMAVACLMSVPALFWY